MSDTEDSRTPRDAESDHDVDNSDASSEVHLSLEASQYDIWKENAQYLYDLLLYNHVSWPSVTCAWGRVINEDSLNSISPLSQVFYYSSHTDGTYYSSTKMWKSSPETITEGSVEMTRRRGTQSWFIGKYNDGQRNRNFVGVKHLVHPGGVGRIKLVPGSNWLVSHSNDSKVHLWFMPLQRNHFVRDNSDPSTPDLSCQTANKERLQDYPLSIYRRAEAMGGEVSPMELPNRPVSRGSSKRSKPSTPRSKKSSSQSKKSSKKGKSVEVNVKEVKEEDVQKEEEGVKEEVKEVEEEVKEEEKEDMEVEKEAKKEAKKEEEAKEEDMKEEEVKEGMEIEKEEEKKEEKRDGKEEENVKEVKEEENVKEEEEKKEVIEEKEKAKEEEATKEKESTTDKPNSTDAVQTATPVEEELPVESVESIHNPTAPSEVVILACSKTSLHFWPFPELQTVALGRRSISVDLTRFDAAVSIEDASFLDGFDREGTTVGVACKSGVVLVVSTATGQLLHNLSGAHTDDVHCVMNIMSRHADDPAAASELNNYMVTGGADKKVLVWDLRRPFDAEGKPAPIITLEVDSAVMCMDFCPRMPRYIAVGTESGEIDLFDVQAKGAEEHLILRHLGHRCPVNDLQFNPYEPLTVLSVSDDVDSIGGGAIEVWRPHELLFVDIEGESNNVNPTIEELVSLLKKK